MTTKEIKDRDAAEKAKAAPITLPAGSYTLEDIEKIHAAAVKAKPEDRQRVVDEAVEKANQAFTERPNQGLERSEEHTSELQSLMRISYAVFCLKKKNTDNASQTATRYS